MLIDSVVAQQNLNGRHDRERSFGLTRRTGRENNLHFRAHMLSETWLSMGYKFKQGAQLYI